MKRCFKNIWSVNKFIPMVLLVLATTNVWAAVDHFSLTQPNGDAVPANWLVGVPVVVSITACSDEIGTLDNTFNDTIELRSSLDWDTSLKCVNTNPGTVTLTNGWWQGQVMIYRSNQNNFFSNSISLYYSSELKGTSDAFQVWQGSADRMLIVAPGMAYKPGIAPSLDPTGENTISGIPSVQTAGLTITAMTFCLCDQYWNTVTDTAQGANETFTISCSDNKATLDGATAVSTTRSLNSGAYSANHGPTTGFNLYTVDSINNQWIAAAKGILTPFTLDGTRSMKVKHAANVAAFTINAPTTDWTAGVARNITLTAVDAFGNTMDSVNGAVALSTYTQVILNSGVGAGGNKAIWPYIVGNLESNKWIEGVSYPYVYCYKKVSGGGQYLVVSYTLPSSAIASGQSKNFNVIPNVYTRVVPIITNMNFPDSDGAGGTYNGDYLTAPPAGLPSVFNNFGTPGTQVAGVTPTILRAYTCDAYGNVVTSPTGFISMTSTDRFALNSAAAQAAAGYANFYSGGFKFHTKGTSNLTMQDITNTDITPGATPIIQVNPGSFYGLQMLIYGLTAIEGSGTTNTTNVNPVPSNGWYSGVTITSPHSGYPVYLGSQQIQNVPFIITVQAADMFGNFVNTAPNDTIRLTSTDNNTEAYPSVANYRDVTLSNGRAYLNGALVTSAIISINVSDQSDTSIKGSPDSLAMTQIIMEDQTEFVVWVNGVNRAMQTTIDVDGYPNTFTVRVEVQYESSHTKVGKNIVFEIDASYNLGLDIVPNYDQYLTILSGLTHDGVAVIPNEAYKRKENIYLRIKAVGGATLPSIGYSPLIRVLSSEPTATPTVTLSPTVTSTITPTCTISPTATITPTSTISPTISVTPSITTTFTQSPTFTATATITPTASVTPTATQTMRAQESIEQVIAFPNPAKTKVTFTWTDANVKSIKIIVFNMNGERVVSLQENLAGGSNQLVWNAKNVATGVYLYQAVLNVDGSEKKQKIRKLAIIR